MVSDRYRDGSGWEVRAGYSRAAREGDRIAVSGTTAHGPDGNALHRGDAYRQTVVCLERAVRAVEELGGRRESILRSRVYLAPEADWQEAARAHADVLGDVAPANTMLYVHRLIGDGFLVEVELDACETGSAAIARISGGA
jgi:enamine deaminase RidA (YjgF/YER057c/UK114 family)